MSAGAERILILRAHTDAGRSDLALQILVKLQRPEDWRPPDPLGQLIIRVLDAETVSASEGEGGEPGD